MVDPARVRLVHLYVDVDDRRIHEEMKEGVQDLDAFAVAIARLV